MNKRNKMLATLADSYSRLVHPPTVFQTTNLHLRTLSDCGIIVS